MSDVEWADNKAAGGETQRGIVIPTKQFVLREHRNGKAFQTEG